MGFKPRKQRRKSNGRLHQRTGRFLVMLLEAERQMGSGTLEEREVLANKGVPWEARKTAAILGTTPAALNHTRETLTKNRMLHCVAEGRGQGRRISHVRLAGRGLEEAECFKVHQMSMYAWGRECMRRWSERDEEADEAYAAYLAESDEATADPQEVDEAYAVYREELAERDKAS